MKIILGSKSYGRREVLAKAGYEFVTMPADIDEKSIRSDDFGELPLLLARAKTKELLKRIQEPAILITSDQVIVYNGQLREKPETEEQARDYLSSYGNDWMQTNTAVVVTNTETNEQVEGLDIAKVYIKPIPQNIIEDLIKEGRVFHAAGGIIVEHPLMRPFVHKIEGKIDSVTGLPLDLTKNLIEKVRR